MTHLKAVLTLLKDGCLTMKLLKCFFLEFLVEYLGHIMRAGCLYVSSKTCNAVKFMQPSTNVTQLRSFPSLCNVYLRRVSNFARIATPLTYKLRNHNHETFPDMNEVEINSFRNPKEALVKPPMLSLPRSDLTYALDTDACDK